MLMIDVQKLLHIEHILGRVLTRSLRQKNVITVLSISLREQSNLVDTCNLDEPKV